MAGTAGAVAPNGENAPDITDDAIDAATPEPTTDEMVANLYKERAEDKARSRAQQEMISGLNAKLAEAEKRMAQHSEAMNELLERSRGAEDRGFAYEQDAAYARMRKAAS